MPLCTEGEHPSVGGAQDRSLLVHHDAAAVPAARRLLVDALRGDPVTTGVADEAAVVASELLGNAVRHAAPLEQGAVLLVWCVRPGEVEIAVVDGGGGRTPASREADAMATGGRGLHIIGVLSQRWGCSVDAHGHRSVWACLTTAAPALARTA